MKIKWSDLLSRVRELELSEFSNSYKGRVVKEGGVVAKAGVTEDRGIWIILQDGEDYIFPNAPTWALLGIDGESISLIRGVEPPYEYFTFRLKDAFVMPQRTEKEKEALLRWVLNRL